MAHVVWQGRRGRCLLLIGQFECLTLGSSKGYKKTVTVALPLLFSGLFSLFMGALLFLYLSTAFHFPFSLDFLSLSYFRRWYKSQWLVILREEMYSFTPSYW